MVGFVRGKILSKNLDTFQVIVANDSAGFEVTITKALFEKLSLEETVALWVHTHVREDILQLYGFETESEKYFFRVLIGISGLGPRTALALLTEHGPDRLTQYIIQKDTDAISEAPGVGKKLAERLVLELASKIEKMAWISQLQKAFPTSKPIVLSAEKQLREDLSSALANLGYQPQHVKVTIDRMFEREAAPSQSFEGWLKAALKELSGRPTKMVSTEISTNG